MDDQRTNRESGGSVISFSIKRLLTATAICAIGLGVLASVDHYPPGIGMYMLIAGCGLVCAGAFLPFRHPIIGTIVGAFAGFGWVIWELAHFHT
jgi:hypothetical protein